MSKKNWSVVRHFVGYDRFDTEAEYNLLPSIYDDLNLYVNFFQLVLKLVGKVRVDARTIKSYDQALTPFRRVLALDLPYEVKARLMAQYVHLNPVTLRANIDTQVALLWKIFR
jgi:hypothetical protein